VRVGAVRHASKVDIQDVSSIAFEGKNGKHWELHGVFYIPALRKPIMSLGRLDEGGSEMRIKDGILRIWDRRGRLMIKVQRSPNHLYIHRFNAVEPSHLAQAPSQRNGDVLCLAARKDGQACTSCARRTWCPGCRRSSTTAGSTTPASSPSRGAPPSPLRPSTARRTSSSWCMATCAGQCHRRRPAAGVASCCWWMTPRATCGCRC